MTCSSGAVTQAQAAAGHRGIGYTGTVQSARERVARLERRRRVSSNANAGRQPIPIATQARR
jgi:hypothetical protein